MAPPDQDVTEAAVRTWCGDHLAKALRIQRNRIESDANFAGGRQGGSRVRQSGAGAHSSAMQVEGAQPGAPPPA